MTKKTREPKKLRSFKEMLEMPANDGQASSRPAPPLKKRSKSRKLHQKIAKNKLQNTTNYYTR